MPTLLASILFRSKHDSDHCAVALMSRPVAGVRNKTLILTLPGSPKGAKENLLSVLKLLPHACMQAAGQDSRQLHAGGLKKLEADTGLNKQESGHHHHDDGHSHSHHGHTIPKAHTKPEDRPVPNDPRAGTASRHRKSPYPMLSVNEALSLVSQNCPEPITVQVAVSNSVIGYLLAEDVRADAPVPAFRASIVDGYAVTLSPAAPTNSKGVFPVVSVSHANPSGIAPLETGQISRITTGAPLPPRADAVVMVEDTVIRSMTEDGQEEATVEILTDSIKAGENVREVGSDINLGEIILKKGEEITAVGGELGLLASVGASNINVLHKPVVGVLSTGDEIVQHDRPGGLQLGEVRDCNRPTLLAAVQGWGYEAIDLGIARDRVGSLEEHLRSAMKSVDVIITSGGVSMGELDLLKPTIERSLGGTIHFGRVSMKPGKPTTFATVPFKDPTGNHQAQKPIFSLPGNPASAIVTAHLFVLPCLQQMSGKSQPWGLPKVEITLQDDVKCDPVRAEYHRVRLDFGQDGRLQAHSTGGQRSSRVGSLKGASGLLCLPTGGDVLKAGTKCEALVMGDLRGL